MNLWQAGKVVSVFYESCWALKVQFVQACQAGVIRFESSLSSEGLNMLLNIHNRSRTIPHTLTSNTLSFMSILSTINTLFVFLISWLKLLWMPSSHQSQILFSVPSSSSSTLTICDVTSLLVRTEGSHAPQTRRSGKHLSGSHSGY